MANWQVMPGDGALNPFTVPGAGRRYSCATGSSISVPDFDALILCSAGWVSLGTHFGLSGTTANRPTAPLWGEPYVDTTLNIVAIYAGKTTGWLNAATGASV